MSETVQKKGFYVPTWLIAIVALALIAGAAMQFMSSSEQTNDENPPVSGDSGVGGSGTGTGAGSGSGAGGANPAESGNVDESSDDSGIEGLTVKGLSIVNEYWQDTLKGEGYERTYNVKLNTAYVKIYEQQNIRAVNIFFLVKKNDLPNIEIFYKDVSIKNIRYDKVSKYYYADINTGSAEYFNWYFRHGESKTDGHLFSGGEPVSIPGMNNVLGWENPDDKRKLEFVSMDIRFSYKGN